MDKPTLLVLAAGMGSRYGGLKQMDPMGPSEETVLDYSVYDAMRSGFGSVTFIIRPDFAEEFKEKVVGKFAGRFPVHYAYQELDKLPGGFKVPEGREKPWGTGHAVLCAKDVVKGNFAVINADDFYGQHSYQQLCKFLMQEHDESKKAQFCMVGFQLDRTLSDHGTVARGVCAKDANDYLTSINEMTKIAKVGSGAENLEKGNEAKLTGKEPCSMNMFGFSKKFFDKLEAMFIEFLKAEGDQLKSEFFVPKIVDKMIKTGIADCKVLPTDSTWFGVTYQEDRPMVVENLKKLIAEGKYPNNLWA